MRQIIKHLAVLERVDQLIRLKATGKPKQLARRLQVSVATVFRIIETMKALDAPIMYDLHRQSYVYTEITSFKCGFYIEELDVEAKEELTGGYGRVFMNRILNFNTNTCCTINI
ncbi:hypothetical protein [Eudoraea chungangensis]|uniref:hypothetical protein n=1 Tax=Eudoraea chungangensis TaxID=1481905 RepID=UPI0023EC8C33|nr:hypothetical protein [Eudoraea chungangensis]